MTEKAAGRADSPAQKYADFDDYLRARGIDKEVKAAVEKRIIAIQLEQRRTEAGISKAELARRVGTSRTQIDRILDPRSQNITIETLSRVAAVMGKRLHLELID